MLGVAQVAIADPVAAKATGRRHVAAVVAAVAAMGAMLVLAFRADGWSLAYNLGLGGAELAVAPWLSASASAAGAVVGALDERRRRTGQAGWRVPSAARTPLRVVVVLATVWSVALLPFDALRAVRLIPLGVSGWGLSLRLLLVAGAAGALVAAAPRARRERCGQCGRAVPGALALLPRWPGWVAVGFALPYPALRTVWALVAVAGVRYQARRRRGCPACDAALGPRHQGDEGAPSNRAGQRRSRRYRARDQA